MKGGYVSVDCNGIDLSVSTKQTVSGIYAKTKEALESGKPIFAYNMIYGTGRKVSPIQVFGWVDNKTFIMNSGILQVFITEADEVTVTVNIPE